MRIQLVDRNRELCAWWLEAFQNCKDVYVSCGNFFKEPTDCVVSPANSFGFMDGGLDLAISNKFGWDVQRRLQNVIRDKYDGELLVGQAELIETFHESIPYCISAPTMRVPMQLTDTVNVYLASKAIFRVLKHQPTGKINSVTISGLGTGVGKVPYPVMAHQMFEAYKEVWLGQKQFPINWKNAQDRHQLMYNNFTRDLQF